MARTRSIEGEKRDRERERDEARELRHRNRQDKGSAYRGKTEAQKFGDKITIARCTAKSGRPSLTCARIGAYPPLKSEKAAKRVLAQTVKTDDKILPHDPSYEGKKCSRRQPAVKYSRRLILNRVCYGTRLESFFSHVRL